MVINDPVIYVYHNVILQAGFQFPFSNESLTENKLQFIVDKYNGIAGPTK